MYRLGDVFQASVLSQYAVGQFENAVRRTNWTAAEVKDFCEAAEIAYRSTPASNQGLRDAVDLAVEQNLAKLRLEARFAELLETGVRELSARVLLATGQKRKSGSTPDDSEPRRMRRVRYYTQRPDPGTN